VRSTACNIVASNSSVLYENIDQILPNKVHGPMHYRKGVTFVYNGHTRVIYSAVIT